MNAILILAAGASRRMKGRDKLLEDVDGVPLLRRQVLRALATGHPVWVTLPAEPHSRYDALMGLEVTLVPVADADEGMNASLRAGLSTLPTTVRSAMIVLADMPDITTEDMNEVLQEVEKNTEMLIWRATTMEGAQGHPIVFSAQLFPQLVALSGDGGGAAVVRQHAARTVLVPLPDDHARTDLDTPEAWATWRARR